MCACVLICLCVCSRILSPDLLFCFLFLFFFLQKCEQGEKVSHVDEGGRGGGNKPGATWLATAKQTGRSTLEQIWGSKMLPWLLRGKRLTSEIKRALHSKMQEHPQTPGDAASTTARRRPCSIRCVTYSLEVDEASICLGRERKSCRGVQEAYLMPHLKFPRVLFQ